MDEQEPIYSRLRKREPEQYLPTRECISEFHCLTLQHILHRACELQYPKYLLYLIPHFF